MTEPETLPQTISETAIPEIPPAGAAPVRAERPVIMQPTLRMMEQSVHTMRQTSMTGHADGSADFRSEVRVGVKRIVVGDLPAPQTGGSGTGQGTVLTVTPALILGVVTGIGSALVASAVHASAAVVGLCYGLPVVSGLLLTVLRNARHRRK